jgi:hypothetical protein
MTKTKKSTPRNAGYEKPAKNGKVPQLRIPEEAEKILRKAAQNDHRTYSGYCAMWLTNHAYEISSKREKIEY